MDVPEFPLKEVHLVLEGFRATYGKQDHITAKAPPTQKSRQQTEVSVTVFVSD